MVLRPARVRAYGPESPPRGRRLKVPSCIEGGALLAVRGVEGVSAREVGRVIREMVRAGELEERDGVLHKRT